MKAWSYSSLKKFKTCPKQYAEVKIFKNFTEPPFTEATLYGTNFHEFAHATGHKSRLARGLDNTFGSDAYAEEELVAELAAAFIGAEFQIDGQCQHPAYLGHWFKVLDNDKQLFYRAASKAKKAVTFIKEAAKRGSKSVPQAA